MAKMVSLRRLGVLLLLCLVVTAWARTVAAPAPPAAGGAKQSSPPGAAKLPAVIANYQIRTDRSGSQPNWFTGQLEVVGIGYTEGQGGNAKYQAQFMADCIMRTEAARAVAALSIDGKTALGSLTGESAQYLLTMYLKGLTVIDEQWRANTGTYTVVGVLPLYGPNGATALGLQHAMLSAPLTQTDASELSLITHIQSGYTPQRFTAPYTGVIVDADGVMLSPCLYPDLLRPDGIPFWGPITERNPFMVANGQMRYAPNLATAVTQNMAGARPLIITAVGSGMGCHPVMNIDDVYLALKLQQSDNLLERRPVVITLGE